MARQRLSVLDLAARLGNATEACRRRGIAFSQLRTDPTGERVACQAMLQLAAGQIARQITLVVWDP